MSTSQRGWAEALTSLLTARAVPAVALDPSGRPWDGTSLDDTGADGHAGPDQPWPVLLVDASDVAAPHIVSSVPADVRVALGQHRPPALNDIDLWVDPGEPRRLATTLLQPRVSGRRGSVGRNRRADEPTAREQAVLELLREGLSNAEIARGLGMSPNTVRTHVQNLLAKLGAHSRFEAAVIANSGGCRTHGEVMR